MKRMICMGLALLVALAGFVGCSSEKEGTANPPASVLSDQQGDDESTVDTASAGETAENSQLTEVGCPPLPENFQLMFQAAQEMVRGFNLSQFQSDAANPITLNGMEYFPIIDTRFNTMDKLETYLAQYFTKEFIDSSLLTSESCVQEHEGLPYVLNVGASPDQTYAGHVFTVDSQTDSKIEMTATVYFSDDVYSGSCFYTTPSNPEDYTTKEMHYTLEYTDDGWRYSQFPYMQG